MRIVKGSKNQCVPTSLAMVLDLPVSKVLEELGHDGSDIVSDEPEPNCFRSFHAQELIDVCQRYGQALVCLELHAIMMHGNTIVDHSEFLDKDRINNYLNKYDAIMFGYLGNRGDNRGHCVAWNHHEKVIYDPRGYMYLNSPESDFTPLQVYILQRIESHGDGLQ